MNRSERRKQKKTSQYIGFLRHQTYNSQHDCECYITEKDLMTINGELFVRCPNCGYEVPSKCIVSWERRI